VVGDAGVTVPEGDAAGLGAALRRLYEEPGLRAELGKRGRRRALEHFTHQRVARLTYEAYRQVLV
jgi:glycosyltransferase involved in cell wall biosynthesis